MEVIEISQMQPGSSQLPLLVPRTFYAIKGLRVCGGGEEREFMFDKA
jgi:hypothetical protein